MNGVQPETCVAAGCDRRGEALVEQYVTANPVGTIGLMEPSGNWIWLCGPHVVEEFS